MGEYSSPDEVAVCNLASIAVNQFVDKEKKTYDFNGLKKITKIATKNLNKIIDVNYYPVEEAKSSNLRHRPIGIGVQGLADAFILMRYPFESPEAQMLNKQIFETIYYATMEASCELAEKEGPYETYQGSPVSKGIFQYDMWGVKPTDLHDWSVLKSKVKDMVFVILCFLPRCQLLQRLKFWETMKALKPTQAIFTRDVYCLANFRL